jgi:hypothetical protein
MTIYLIAEPASKHALRITTGELYDSIHNVFFACLNKYNSVKDKFRGSLRFKDFIFGGRFIVSYSFELNKKKTYRKISATRLWGMFCEGESLKKEITKLELKDEFCK